jgi:hypothetical protein
MKSYSMFFLFFINLYKSLLIYVPFSGSKYKFIIIYLKTDLF